MAIALIYWDLLFGSHCDVKVASLCALCPGCYQANQIPWHKCRGDGKSIQICSDKFLYWYVKTSHWIKTEEFLLVWTSGRFLLANLWSAVRQPLAGHRTWCPRRLEHSASPLFISPYSMHSFVKHRPCRPSQISPTFWQHASLSSRISLLTYVFLCFRVNKQLTRAKPDVTWHAPSCTYCLRGPQ